MVCYNCEWSKFSNKLPHKHINKVLNEIFIRFNTVTFFLLPKRVQLFGGVFDLLYDFEPNNVP